MSLLLGKSALARASCPPLPAPVEWPGFLNEVQGSVIRKRGVSKSEISSQWHPRGAGEQSVEWPGPVTLLLAVQLFNRDSRGSGEVTYSVSFFALLC